MTNVWDMLDDEGGADVGLEDDGETVEQAPPKPETPVTVVRAAVSGDDIFEEMGLQAQRAVPNPEYPWMKHHEFVLVKTVAEVRDIVDRCLANGKCALDLETEGLDTRTDLVDGKLQTRHRIVGYCLSVDGKAGYYVPVRHRKLDDNEDPNVRPVDDVEAEIRRLCLASQPVMKPDAKDPLGGREADWLEPPRVVIRFWHAKFDQEMLLPVTGIFYWHPESFEDGMLAYFVFLSEDKSLGLKDKSETKLRDPEGNPYTQIKYNELFVGRREHDFAGIYPDEPGVTKYACSDAICTYLHIDHPDVQKVLTDKKFMGVYRIEKQTAQAMRAMERCRMLIDKGEVRKLMAEALEELAGYEERIQKLAEAKGFRNFNPGSTKQLGDFLFSEKGLDLKPKPAKNEKSGNYKTDAATLEHLIDGQEDQEDNVLVWIVKHRQIGKIVGTYLEGMLSNTDEHDQLRFGFNQCGAATGRFSAPGGDAADGFSAIPIHGIPARNDPKRPKCANSMRRIFVARPGYLLVKSDYAGQELRIAANVSGEQVWIKEFLHGSGDLHSITARAFFGKEDITKDERNAGKRANFALIYGGGYQAIVRATGCTEMEGKRRKAAFDKSVPSFAKWVKSQHGKVKQDLGVKTAFGRWIAIPNANVPDDRIRSACERCSTNYPIQGSGADVMKIGLISLYKAFHKRGWLLDGGDDSVRMLLTVHDEIVFEIREELLREVMPVIIEVMEAPWRLPANPRWVVPLIVEPVVGKSWAAKYDWAQMIKGRPAKPGETPKDGEVLIDGRIYQQAPDWLVPHMPPMGALPDATPVQAPAAVVPTDPVPAAAAPAPDAVSPVVNAPVPVAAPEPRPAVVEDAVVTCCLGALTSNTVRLVSVACMEARDLDRGKVLRLVDVEGNVLIDPRLGVRIDPEVFLREAERRNLGIGRLPG